MKKNNPANRFLLYFATFVLLLPFLAPLIAGGVKPFLVMGILGDFF